MSFFHRLALVASCVLLILASSSRVHADECNGDDYGTAGQFDFYILTLSWPAEFCASHSSWPGCTNPTEWQQTNLTMHGMWPNYAQPQGAHAWPQCCPSSFGSTLDPTVAAALLPTWQTLWPNEQDPTGSNLTTSLWNHEWGKHGTCSGLDQKKYFTTAMELELSLPTPSAITANIGGSVSYSALATAFDAADCAGTGDDCIVGFTCDSDDDGQALSAVTTCWSPDFERIVCPSSVFSDDCDPSSDVEITSFDSDDGVIGAVRRQ